MEEVLIPRWMWYRGRKIPLSEAAEKAAELVNSVSRKNISWTPKFDYLERRLRLKPWEVIDALKEARDLGLITERQFEKIFE